jgi:hypothetical protein
MGVMGDAVMPLAGAEPLTRAEEELHKAMGHAKVRVRVCTAQLGAGACAVGAGRQGRLADAGAPVAPSTSLARQHERRAGAASTDESGADKKQPGFFARNFSTKVRAQALRSSLAPVPLFVACARVWCRGT